MQIAQLWIFANCATTALILIHDQGKHKARVFAAGLGMTVADAELLRDVLLWAVKTYPAQAVYQDAYGQRYAVDFPMEWKGQKAVIRSAWILEHGSNIPRLTSCYLL